MGHIDATSVAHERSVLATNPAATCEHSNICDSITNRRLALVRGPNPARLSPTSKALAVAGGTRWCFTRCVTISKRYFNIPGLIVVSFSQARRPALLLLRSSLWHVSNSEEVPPLLVMLVTLAARPENGISSLCVDPFHCPEHAITPSPSLGTYSYFRQRLS